MHERQSEKERWREKNDKNRNDEDNKLLLLLYCASRCYRFNVLFVFLEVFEIHSI